MSKEQESISNFLSKLSEIAEKVNEYLDKWLPQNEEEYSANLNEAMRYSVMAGGKRIRPALTVLTAEAFGFKGEAVYRAGCAYELYHSASLIHDDLPCMDDDDLRRGKPTNHKVFGEATAVLAGDCLMLMPYEWFGKLGEYDVSEDKIVKIMKIANEAFTYRGVIGGQMLDLRYENKKIDQETLERIHMGKTAALLRAPILTGAVLADANSDQLKSLKTYSHKIGLLFQIVDDILDIESDAATLGKNTGRDVALGKSTYPALLGIDGAKEYAKKTYNEAIKAIEPLGDRMNDLKALALYLLNRKS
jgi:geranylgeranyl diphosphate synthase type II